MDRETRRDGNSLFPTEITQAGAAIDLFGELVSFPELVAHPNLTLEVLLTREEEVRRCDGNRAWRRKGWVTGSAA